MNSNKMTVSVAKIVELLDLKSFNDIDLKSRKITCSDVNRPALQLTGYFNHFEQSRVQIIGNVEYAYTQGLTQAQRKENYDKLLELIQYETLQSLKKINEKIEKEKGENGEDATENN